MAINDGLELNEKTKISASVNEVSASEDWDSNCPPIASRKSG